MRIVSTSYNKILEFNNPQDWLKRISFYTGILEQLALQNEMISFEHIDYEGDLLQNAVQYHFIPQKKMTKIFPYKKHCLIKKMQPDMVMINGFIYPLQIIQLRLKLGSGIKIIVINHAEKPFTGLRKVLQRLADRCVNMYFFTSAETGAAWVQRGIIASEHKIAEVMEASSFFYTMNKEKALARTGANGSPVFLWVGRLDANKDPLTVIKAFGAFINHQPSAKLYMIYHTEELKQEILFACEKNNDLKKAVKLVGKVPHVEMQYWYNSADFIISASHYEGSGVAVCEAMSCGCVPLLTNIQSFRKMTGHGKCGLLFEPGNDAALLKVLLQTAEMDIEKEKNKVLQQFNEELSFEAIAKKIEQVIALI